MSPFRIDFSQNAQDRLKQRRITRKDVRRCLIDGMICGVDIRGRKIKRLGFSKRVLEVVYLETANTIVIVTAYWKGIYL